MSNTTLHPPMTNHPLSDALLKAICDSETVGVQIGHGYEGHMSYVNDAFLAMIGYTRDEFESGKISWQDLSPPEAQAIDETAVNNMKTYKATAPFEKQYIHKKGHRVDMSMQVVLIPGSEMDWICYMVDISHQKQAQ